MNTIKKLLVLSFLLVLALGVYAQNKRYYCEIKGVEKDFSSGLKIVFDFGRQPSIFCLGWIEKQTKTCRRER